MNDDVDPPEWDALTEVDPDGVRVRRPPLIGKDSCRAW